MQSEVIELDHAEKQYFKELRTKGFSISAIAKGMQKSRNVLIKWDSEFKDEIREAQTEQKDTLIKNYLAFKNDNMKFISDTADLLQGIIDKAAAEEITLDKAIFLRMKLVEMANKEVYPLQVSNDYKTIEPEELAKELNVVYDNLKKGVISAEQAETYVKILNGMIKAYEISDLKRDMDAVKEVLDIRKSTKDKDNQR